jgi:hypothetical protein
MLPTMSPRTDAARGRALDALALTRREHLSLTRASRDVHTDPRTVRRYAGRAFRKEGRRWKPRSFDRIPRAMRILTDEGPMLVVVRDSRTASLLAEHSNAVQHYLHTGDTSRLKRLRRRRVQIDGEQIALVMSPQRIDRLAEGAELHYELYRR